MSTNEDVRVALWDKVEYAIRDSMDGILLMHISDGCRTTGLPSWDMQDKIRTSVDEAIGV